VVVAAALSDSLYRIMFLLHIVAVVVAFSAMVVNPFLAARSKADGEGALTRTASYMAANGRQIHLPALILVGLFGLGMVFSSTPDGADDALFGFDQIWVSLALLVWIVMCGLVSGMLIPAERKLAAGDLAQAKKIELGGQIVTVLFLVMLYLMIWKPGL
jgi:uncharacterized membrane protein